MKHPYATAVLATVMVAGAASALYVTRHAARYGPDALTPLEAWLVTRSQRGNLDRELLKITSDSR